MIEVGKCYDAYIEKSSGNIKNPVYLLASLYKPIYDPRTEKKEHAFICDIYDSNGRLHISNHILENNIVVIKELSSEDCQNIFFEDILEKFLESMESESYEYS